MHRSQFLLITLALWACNGGGGTDDFGLDGTMDMAHTDMAQVDMGAPPLPDFVLRMQADSRIGGVGQAFRIIATPGGEPPADLTWTWYAPDGMGDADGAVYTVRFDTPGRYTIEVTAEADGTAVTEGVILQVYPDAPALGDVNGSGTTEAADLERLRAFLQGTTPLDDAAEGRADVDRNGAVDTADVAALTALLAGESLRWARPAAGSRGTLVQLAHPAFVDPTARFTARFNETELPLDRGTPGFATVVIPLEADQAAAAEISIWQDDAAVHRFAFDVLAPPTVNGDEVPRAFELMQGAFEVLPPLMEAYLTDLEVPDDARALMTAMLQAVSAEMTAERAHFATYWEQLSPEQQAIYTEVALANGLDTALADLERIGAELRAGMGQISTERLIELICLAQDISGVAKTVARVNNIAAYVIDALWFLSFFVPPLAPVVAGLSTANELISAVTDVLQLLMAFVPQLGDSIDLTAMPATLARGEQTTIDAAITVHVAGGLCAGGAGLATHTLIEKLKERLMARIFGRVPGFGKVYRRARNQRNMVARLVNTIARFLGQIIDVVLDATGLEDRFKAMATAVCEAVVPGEPWALATGDLEWTARCGDVVDGVWTCTQECGDQVVTVTAERSLCGAAVRGSVGVDCGGCRALCPDGCCTADGTCIDSADQDVAQCGSQGRRCGACADEQVCENGACACVSTCAEDEIGTMRCADEATAETCEAASDGCFRWTAIDCAAGGATCEDGVCTGGCGGWNCAGCCSAEHVCTALEDQGDAVCGRGGRRCGGCVAPDECVGGTCICRGPDCEPVFQAGSRGDPHLITFDGLAYDFQGAGEFVLVRSGSGADRFEIQTRQVPVRDPLCSLTATVNQAAAFALGDVRITFDAQRTHPFWVDGLAVDPPLDMDWPVGSGTLHRHSEREASLRWADGSAVRLLAWGSLHLSIHLAAARTATGLLGDADGDPANDMRLADGTVVERPVPFDTLYGAFADGWRVTAESSLFDYDPGTGPADWAIADYPNQLASPDRIPEATRVSADALCAELGIDDPVLRTACIIDIACTGDPAQAAPLLDLAPPADTIEVVGAPVDPADVEACIAQPRWIPDDEDGGATISHFCPAACIDVDCLVYGTDVYTSDSCLCRAAIHAGVLAPGQAGMVEFHRMEERGRYTGSERNGVRTNGYNNWPWAFQFPVAIPACRRRGADFLLFEPADGCEENGWYCYDCPADCPEHLVWGTDVYHENSSLCSAAVHAGVIDAEDGGRVFFQFPLNEAEFVGLERNGIESYDRDAWPVGLEFRSE